MGEMVEFSSNGATGGGHLAPALPRHRPRLLQRPRPEVYDDDDARQAWVRTLELLRAKLG